VIAPPRLPMGSRPGRWGHRLSGRDKVRDWRGDIADAYERLLKFFRKPVGRALPMAMKKHSGNSFKPSSCAGPDPGRGEEERGVTYCTTPRLRFSFHSSPYGDGADAFIVVPMRMVAAEAMGLGPA